jgi:hypothetical protein
LVIYLVIFVIFVSALVSFVFALRVSEIAVRRTLHDRLRADEAYVGIETFDERCVTVAGEHGAQLRDPQLSVHFGIPAARDVEG